MKKHLTMINISVLSPRLGWQEYKRVRFSGRARGAQRYATTYLAILAVQTGYRFTFDLTAIY